MTSPAIHVCRPPCELHLTPATEAYMNACPECGDPAQPRAHRAGAMALGIVAREDRASDPARPRPIAIAMTPRDGVQS